MKTKHWVLDILGKRHNVIARWELYGGAGEVWDNGKLVDYWNSLSIISMSRKFLIGRMDAVLKWSGFSSGECDLYVAGERYSGEFLDEDEASEDRAMPGKGRKRWVVSTNGEQHEVVLHNRESWDGAGELSVDNHLVDSWKSNWGHSPRSFRIGGTDAVFQWQDKRCRLHVAGEYIPGEMVVNGEGEGGTRVADEKTGFVVGTKRWLVYIVGEEHEVILDQLSSYGPGELSVDTQLVESWKSDNWHSPRRFRIGGTDAVLEWEDKRCRLYVAGEFIPAEMIVEGEHEGGITVEDEEPGLDIGTKRWLVSIAGEEHEVILDQFPSPGPGEIWVDGKLLESWNSNIFPSRRRFRIGGTDAVLDKRCKLFIADEFIPAVTVRKPDVARPGWDNPFRDHARDDFCQALRVLGINAQMAERGRTEEKIGSDRSLGVIDLQEGPIRWVNMTWVSYGGGMAGGSTYYYANFGVPDPRMPPDFPPFIIRSVKIKTRPIVGRVTGVRWKGSYEANKYAPGVIRRLQGDDTISIHPNHACWIITVESKYSPTRGLWRCYNAIAEHLLAFGSDYWHPTQDSEPKL